MKPLRPRLWPGTAHLTLAWCLAVAQPLFSLLGRQPQFLVAQGVAGGRLVAFALLLTLAVPALLTLLVYLLRGSWPRLSAWLLNGVIALLLAIACLPPVSGFNPWLALAAAAVVGASLAHARASTSTGRLFANVFAWAIPAFPLAFLWFSPARDLLGDQSTPAVEAINAGSNPVFFFVFDEFPVVSIMDRELAIDGRRFPGFARLAAASTWYRYATTVSDATVVAVPAALTGYFSADDKLKLAVYSQYPRNLFTLLAGSHRVHARESGTRLCPPWVCSPPAGDSAGLTLAADLWIVYQHLVVPRRWRTHLPKTQGRWGGFGSAGLAPSLVVTDAGQMRHNRRWRDRPRQLREFLNEIPQLPTNTFHYYHALLPYAPWVFLPDGRAYAYRESEGVPGVRPLEDPAPLRHSWYRDPAATDLGHRRHLLQVGAVDSLIGEILDAIHASGRYDESLIVITGNHGAAFRPGASRRAASQDNLAEIAGIPMFVKYPHQREGRVVDAPARISDLAPTVLHALGAQPPANADAVALPLLGKRARIRLVGDAGGVEAVDFSQYQAELAGLAERQANRYGEGDFGGVVRPDTLSGNAWLGRSPEEFAVRHINGVRVAVHNAALYRASSGAGFVSAYLRATVEGLAALPRPGRVLVALDGLLTTSATPFSSPGLEQQFATLLPPESIESGVEDLRFYWQADREPEALISLQDPCPEPRLLEANGATRLLSGCSGEETTTTGAYFGEVNARRRADGSIALTGWSANTLSGELPQELLVFVDGALAAQTRPALPSRGLVARYGLEALAHAGFVAYLATDDPAGRNLRVFARGAGGVAELNYPPAGAGGWPFAAPPEPAPIPVDFHAGARARLAAGELSLGSGGFRLGQAMDLTSSGAEPMLLGDWYSASDGLRWAGSRMALAFVLPPGEGDLILELTVRSFLVAGMPQRLRIRAGGSIVSESEINSGGSHRIRVPIPSELVGEDGLLVVEMSAPLAASPQQLGVSNDTRELSFAFQQVRLSLR